MKNGKLNALPIAFNSYEFYYNAPIWEKYNLEFPESWDDFFEAAKVMSEDGIYPIGCVKKAPLYLNTQWGQAPFTKFSHKVHSALAPQEFIYDNR